VYDSLFGKKGILPNGTATSANRQQEERKRELQKMREEAKAARLAECDPKHCFDLQRHSDKIRAFEDKRKEEDRMLWPNTISAAFHLKPRRTY